MVLKSRSSSRPGLRTSPSPSSYLRLKPPSAGTFTQENVLGGFRGSGLIPYDPHAVLSKLDVRLRTPTPPGTPDGLQIPWVPKTPKTTSEALSQSTLIKGQIARHQGSSPTPILSAVDQLSKGMQVFSHQVTLLQAEVRTLQEANEALSKRRRANGRVSKTEVLLMEARPGR
jgi:FtsZ-binding cell division protein ZapB